jgi:ribosome-binding protein aMBF1 (putative translation factor)
MKKMKTEKINLKTINLETILKKEFKNPTFKEKYQEELTTLRLAREIKTLRTAKKLTQESFAKKANMPQSVIARVESGKHTISLSTLDKLAQALGKRIEIV